MHGNLDWPGIVTDNTESFADGAVDLCTNKSIWLEAQHHGIKIINDIFNKDVHSKLLIEKINHLQDQLTYHRRKNFIGAMLIHHTISGTKYMSKWIEEKNKKPL